MPLAALVGPPLDGAAFALPRAYGASAFILPLVALYPPSRSAALALSRAYGASASILSLCRALWTPLTGAAFPLRPLRVAQGPRCCDHVYPRWDGHTPESTLATPPVLGAPASIMGSEFLRFPRDRAPALRFAPPRCPKPSPDCPSLLCMHKLQG